MSVSTSAVVLFIAMATAVTILAVLVDMYAQSVLEEDVRLLANSVADYVASQVRDVIAAGSLPGVISLRQKLFTPQTFFGFDTAAVSICLGNERGFVYVNVTAAGTRGRGEARASAVVWAYNVTKWSREHGKVLTLVGDYSQVDCNGRPLSNGCKNGGGLNLTRDGCSVLVINASLYVKPR